MEGAPAWSQMDECLNHSSALTWGCFKAKKWVIGSQPAGNPKRWRACPAEPWACCTLWDGHRTQVKPLMASRGVSGACSAAVLSPQSPSSGFAESYPPWLLACDLGLAPSCFLATVIGSEKDMPQRRLSHGTSAGAIRKGRHSWVELPAGRGASASKAPLPEDEASVEQGSLCRSERPVGQHSQIRSPPRLSGWQRPLSVSFLVTGDKTAFTGVGGIFWTRVTRLPRAKRLSIAYSHSLSRFY